MENIIPTAIVGIICIALGISNAMGNISTLHSYHRKRVPEESRRPFGRLVGIGTIICGASILAFALLNALSLSLSSDACSLAATITLIAGLVIGIGISFYAMIKYNKGIF